MDLQINECGNWGSNPHVVHRMIGNREELHAFAFLSTQAEAGLAAQGVAGAKNNQLQHMWYDGTWHCDFIDLGGVVTGWPTNISSNSIRQIWSVFVDGSTTTSIGGMPHPAIGIIATTIWAGNYTLSHLELVPNETGKLILQKYKPLPQTGNSYLTDAAVAVRNENSGSSGSINVFYKNTSGRVVFLQKKGTGEWSDLGPIGADENLVAPGGLFAAVTTEGDLHVFANAPSGDVLVHFFEKLGLSGSNNSLQFEPLVRAAPWTVGNYAYPVSVVTPMPPSFSSVPLQTP